ncbi:MAG: efflux RND transporter permease subunit, partial [Pseudomonadota bacterium]|nr:efflux RND transporter permease subunit [Pseudomonadota bacterium]
KKRLETIDGVGEVYVGGAAGRNIRVNLNLSRMAALGVTAQDIQAALRNEHFQLPGGFLVGSNTEYLIKLDHEYHSVKEMEALVVGHRDEAPIYLRDVAEVVSASEDRRAAARYLKTPSIGLGIVKISNANTVAIARKVGEVLEEELRPNLPPGMQLEYSWNEADFIEDSIKALEEHVYLGALLASLVVFLFLLNVRATIIIALAIPVSLLAAIMLIYFAGMTLNMMTMLALLLLIGVVVDDAIVVLENIDRHLEDLDEDPMTAAANGAKEVYFAIVAATFALVSIFGPVIFMTGIIGMFFEAFAIVVTVGVLASLFVAVTLTPMLCSRFLGRSRGPTNPVSRTVERAMLGLQNGYRRFIAGVLHHRALVLVVTVVIVATSGLLFNRIGKTFEPEVDEGGFLISFKTPLGSNLDYTETRMAQIEAVLEGRDDIKDFWAAIGVGPTGYVSRGMVFVRLLPSSERPLHQYDVIDELQVALADIPGVEGFAGRIPAIPGARGEPLQFVIRGTNLDTVAEVAQDFKARLDRDHPELGRVDLDLQLDLPQLELKVDRTRAASLGINTAQLSQAVNMLMGGVDLAYYNDDPGDGERYDVRVKARDGQFTRPEDLRKIYLRSRSGDLVRADTVATLERRLGPAVISRYDLRYSANFYSEPGVPLGEAINTVKQASRDLPAGHELIFARASKDYLETGDTLAGTLVLSVVLLYMVLASQFNSLIQPLIIMMAQPLAIVGGLFGLWLFDMTLNIYSMIGMILLVGLVAKNSILLVDLANQLREKGKPIDDALLEACPIRLRPVLMTSLTIILAMLPAALGFGAGAEANGPMAVTIIFGMLSSTLLTLAVIPALYSLVEHGLERWRASALHGRLWRPSVDRAGPAKPSP